jgi:hypothetical protein
MYFLASQHEIALRYPINLELADAKRGSNDTIPVQFLAFTYWT